MQLDLALEPARGFFQKLLEGGVSNDIQIGDP